MVASRATIKIAPATSGILSGVVGAIPIWLTADRDADLKGWLAFLGITLVVWIVRSALELLSERS